MKRVLWSRGRYVEAWIIVGRTQWMVLSAAIDNPRIANAMPAPNSIVRPAVGRRRRQGHGEVVRVRGHRQQILQGCFADCVPILHDREPASPHGDCGALGFVSPIRAVPRPQTRGVPFFSRTSKWRENWRPQRHVEVAWRAARVQRGVTAYL